MAKYNEELSACLKPHIIATAASYRRKIPTKNLNKIRIQFTATVPAGAIPYPS